MCMIVMKRAEAPRTMAASLDPVVESSPGELGSANHLCRETNDFRVDTRVTR
jgi:hypothetical protein